LPGTSFLLLPSARRPHISRKSLAKISNSQKFGEPTDC